jgi:hypothetical protein
VKGGDNAGSGNAGFDIKPEGLKLLRDKGAGQLFLERGFGVGMQMVSPLGEFINEFGGARMKGGLGDSHLHTLLHIGKGGMVWWVLKVPR